MTVTTPGLVRAAGVSAAVSGLIFILVQINHPPMVAASVDTTEWVLRLVGFVMISVAYLVIGSVAFVSAYVLPGLAHSNPGYVQGVLDTAAGNPTSADIGPMSTVLSVEGLFYVVGGVVFGIALYRARVLARWAAVLLSLATVATLALAFLPESFDRPMAVPTGVAFIGLGLSLWRDRRTAEAVTSPTTATREQAAVR
jgi:hypothetical protein